MDIVRCYEELKGNYQEVKKRIASDELIKRFCLKFLQDDSFINLKKAIEKKDYREAFFSVHTLKGVCLNLSFTTLAEKCSELTEYLRNYQNKDIDDNKLNILFEALQNQYNLSIKVIKTLEV
ncbi:MAG: Hpt domain-containing protein [Erysipelotrichaceae bacterium]|nr:Hpt domain-containing protein [Erysipelotrichaceae bacterium]